jgi:16S rRNA (cytidine1402-2'-O)-methyltransferase
VLDELATADVVLCEDTRRTGILLERHGVRAALESYHRHNEAARTASALERLRRGERLALVSDAGLPGVNDPGARLIAAAVDAGLPVTVLPGPSSVETALVVSGLIGEQYQFVGYVPRREVERERFVKELALYPHTSVAFESPRRLPATLAVLAREIPDRPGAICRELTKRFEHVERGTIAEIANVFQEPPRGEVTMVIGPAEVEREGITDAAIAAVGELIEGGISRRQAAEVVARLTGASKNASYDASL